MVHYIVTRDCCLGPCCIKDHPPNKPTRVEQLKTDSKEQAERCAKNYNTYPHTYNAKVSKVD